MPDLSKVKGLDKVVKALRDKVAKLSKSPRVVVTVGYTAAYALWVHENIEMKWAGLPRGRSFRLDKLGEVDIPKKWNRGYYWDPQGQAQSKFLEQPAREMQADGTFYDIVSQALRAGKTLAQAMLLAGLRLQRESQLLVPVDTGNLKASAFTRLETGTATETAPTAGAP